MPAIVFQRKARSTYAKDGEAISLGNRGKGYLHTQGMQSRFIVFLIFLLIAYSFLLRVFQKLAEIVQFPLFLPITLATLLIFVGIVGMIYSHTFVGPISRIRSALEQMALGERDVALRLRESDDPTLKELARTIARMCDNSRTSRIVVQETADELLKGMTKLRESVEKGADNAEIRKHLEVLGRNQELLDKAIKSYCRCKT